MPCCPRIAVDAAAAEKSAAADRVASAGVSFAPGGFSSPLFVVFAGLRTFPLGDASPEAFPSGDAALIRRLFHPLSAVDFVMAILGNRRVVFRCCFRSVWARHLLEGVPVPVHDAASSAAGFNLRQ